MGWMRARASCSALRILPVAPALQPAGPSICHKHSIHGSLDDGAAAGCRSCPAWDTLFCLAELTGHPAAAHLLLPPLPLPGLQTFPSRRPRGWRRCLGQAGRHFLMFQQAGTVIPGSSTGSRGPGRVVSPASIKPCWLFVRVFFTLLFTRCFSRM